MTATLAEVLYACRSEAAAPDAEVETELAALVRECELAWPELRVSREAFVAYLAERIHGDLVSGLRALHARDLYLACACALGDAGAIASFERACFAEIDDALGRMGISHAVRDDAKQILRRRLFVGGEGRAPRIVDYAGRGDLRRWVRAAAVRVTLRLARRERREGPGVDASLLDTIAEPAQDPELDFLKRTYGEAFEAALGEAFAALAPRDRNLLRYYFGKGLSIDELGVVYRIHRATAARRVQRVNAELAAKTRARLAARLGLSHADVSSVLRVIHSQIERTLRAILATAKRAT